MDFVSLLLAAVGGASLTLGFVELGAKEFKSGWASIAVGILFFFAACLALL